MTIAHHQQVTRAEIDDPSLDVGALLWRYELGCGHSVVVSARFEPEPNGIVIMRPATELPCSSCLVAAPRPPVAVRPPQVVQPPPARPGIGWTRAVRVTHAEIVDVSLRQTDTLQWRYQLACGHPPLLGRIYVDEPYAPYVSRPALSTGCPMCPRVTNAEDPATPGFNFDNAIGKVSA